MAARPIATPTASRPTGPRVRDLRSTTTPGVAVDLEARTALDFLISLISDTESELLPDDQRWLDTARASVSDGVRRDMARLGIGESHEDEHSLCGGLGVLVLRAEDCRTAADVVTLANDLDPMDLLRESCEAPSDEGLALADRALHGDRTVAADAAALWPDKLQAPVRELLSDPEGYVAALRRVLRAWREQFEPIEGHVGRMLERDVADRRRDFDSLPLDAFIERATGGLRWAPGQAARRLTLAPSYFARPYNYVLGERDWHVICYPLADTALEGARAEVPAGTIRLYQALGDESRLRILRLLADGDLYLTELAERLDLSKPTVSHHVAHLRAAGLITTTQAGSFSYYTLNRDRVAGLGPELAAYLGLRTN